MLISLAVHEHPKSVEFQISNILKFNPRSRIVLHVAHDLARKMRLSESDRLIINPLSLRSGYLDRSLFFIHLSNLLYAESIGALNCTVAFAASNEVFFKHGAEHYTSTQTFECECAAEDDYHYRGFLSDPLFQWLQSRSAPILKATPEGSFYSHERITEGIHLALKKINFNAELEKFQYASVSRKSKSFLSRSLNRIRPGAPATEGSYAAEELVFPNLFGARLGPNNSYCYMDWRKNLRYDFADRSKILGSQFKFSFKRVDRDPTSDERERCLRDLLGSP